MDSWNPTFILMNMYKVKTLKEGKSKKITFCIYAFFLLFFLNSCVFFPKTKQEELAGSSDCHLRMPEWELKTTTLDVSNACVGVINEYEALGCLAGIGVVIPAGSFIVSGSIVVTGNTIRWLEYQGRCEEGVINKSLALLKASEDEQITESLRIQ